MADLGFLQTLSFGPDGWGPMLLAGALMTVALSLSGFLLAGAIGGVVCWVKICGNRPLRYLADAYTTVIRGIPDLLIIYLLYFGGSQLLTTLGKVFGDGQFVSFPGFLAGMLAVGIAAGAQQTEVFRGAFYAIAPGELEAAKAFGMSTPVRIRRIIIPLLLRHALPGMGNVWQVVLKAAALVSVTGLAELMNKAQTGAGSTGKPFDFYCAAALLYLLISAVSGWSLQKAEGHYSRGVKR
ncbi:ABC transporter permease subunit [Rahnella sp. SAP-1]|jgi:octopine/nopaline transport system permease protein|uniref:ABC transporter permease subunit n=1 Tax=Rouxiella aceris TaxID=2703884 RepID=A0A848MLR7_9GAMM|nr:ABC transporter permease subunit [Rouxiella aceris]NMP28031.1 ABC transporter permease subunit [Rouxiella aceris]